MTSNWPHLLFAEPIQILLQVCLFKTLLWSLFALSHPRNFLRGKDFIPVENQFLTHSAFYSCLLFLCPFQTCLTQTTNNKRKVFVINSVELHKPVFEVLVGDLDRKADAVHTNALQYTRASQLMQHQRRIDHT